MSDKIAPESKADTTNPKDLLGFKKVSITKLPAVAVVHGAHAMMDGAAKYGAYNWRAKQVIASIYVDAAMRHIAAWFEGEETAADSGVHHIGHAIACCAILLDAQETGNLIDDRPVTDKNRAVLTKVLDRLNATIAEKAKAPSRGLDALPITVNGKRTSTFRARVTYEDVVSMAFPDRRTEGILYTVSYGVRGGAGGTLWPGSGHVSVGEDMVFNAVITGDA